MLYEEFIKKLQKDRYLFRYNVCLDLFYVHYILAPLAVF